MLLKVWEAKKNVKRFVSASNLNELKGKGKTRYTFSRGLLSLALPLGLSVFSNADIYVCEESVKCSFRKR